MTEDQWDRKMRRARSMAATYRCRTTVRGYQVKHGWVYVVELSPEGEERHA